MATINDAQLNALLADATYALDRNIDSLGGADLVTAIKIRMTEPVATYIAANFSLVTHIETNDVTGSGFDASVWRRNDGKLYVSMQGTEGLQDFLTDTQLALTGNGRDQLVDMVNWWLQITTPAGQLARQIQVVTMNLLAEATPVAGRGLVSAADLVGGIEVNGHSLGGYLASAFTRLFGAHAHVGKTTTFNSAGFAPGSESVFQQYESLIGVGYGIGRFPSQSEQTNYFAQHGINVTTNSFWFNQVGQRVELFNEADATQVGNHSIYKLTDSLALATALARLDPTVTTGGANALLEEGSNRTAASLEGVLDGLRRLLGGTAVAATPEGDAKDSAASRVAYQSNLKTLTDNAAFSAIAGKVSIAASGVGLANTARTDFASLLSLLTLSPVALKATAGNEVAVESALKTTWNTAYTAWAADKAMTQVDRDAGKTNYTQIYLDDRAAMASWLVCRNTRDNKDLTIRDVNAGEQAFQDIVSSTTIRMGSATTGDSNRRQFLFGGDSVDSLTGGNLNDHVYGGAGNDSLNGQDGADYLEGNAGADTLDGGAGTFNDVLNGGADADLYIVGTKAGFDTIASSEGVDRLQLGGRVLNGSGTFFSSAGGVTEWRDSSVAGDVITYSLDSAAQVLTVTGAHSVVRVRDFVSGDLGISAPVAPAPPPPPATSAFNDFAQVTATPSVAWRDTATPGVANHLVNFSNWYTGSYANLLGISSQAGNDWIEGGAGANTNLKLIKAGSGDDQVYASTTQTLADAVAAQDVAVATGRSDLLLDGGFGNDSVFGAAGDDALFGGDGSDTIVGGAGNDVIFSDGDSGLQYPELNPQATTGFRWVAGSNAAGSWIYFNGAPRFGTVAYGYGGSSFPSQEEQHFTGNYYSIESTDFTPLAALGTVPLAAGDYPAGWTVQADGRFYASYTPTGAFDPQAGYYFNTNRYSGSDVVFAGAGGDMVNAGGGDDYVDAGSGDDMVRGYQGDDQIYGGAGSDNLLGDAYATVGLAEEKYLGVTYRKFGLDPSVAGQEHGNDYIDGGADNDRIEGNGGSDVLLGGSGNDFVFGDDAKTSGGQFIKDEFGGNDYIDTGVGNDFAQGGARNDYILGGGDADSLFGDNHFEDGVPGAGRVTAAGDDTLDGGIGNDSIWGEGGSDSILGGDGNDQLVGDGHISDLRSELHGKDDIDGGAGDDLIFGGGDNDLLRGGDGNDWLAGEDQESASATTTLIGDDVLMGGAGADTLIGGVGADQLSGGDGTDLLDAGIGDDLLDGGSGSDIMLGRDGADTYLFGIGSGSDVIFNADSDAPGSKADTVLLGAGITRENITLRRLDLDSSNLQTSLVIGVSGTTDSLSIRKYFWQDGRSAEAVEFIKFDDGLIWSLADIKAQLTQAPPGGGALYGFESDDTLSGGQGADQLFGLGGADVLYGGSAGDTLTGGNGNDRLDGGAANDRLLGGDGDDTYVFGKGDGQDVIGDASGNLDKVEFRSDVAVADVVVGRVDDALLLSIAGTDDEMRVNSYFASGNAWQVEQVCFSDPLGTIWDATAITLQLAKGTVRTGTASNDSMWGSSAAETFNAGAGNDYVSAGLGNDKLYGEAGDDGLHGGDGNDTLDGGTGQDTLYGGLGNDTFLFGRGSGYDCINLDFDWYQGTTSHRDTIALGTGITTSDVSLYLRPVQDFNPGLILRVNGTDDRLDVSRYLLGNGTDDYPWYLIRFADGTVWDADKVRQLTRGNTTGVAFITGTNASDVLTGSASRETFDAGAGNDSIYAGLSDDELHGGAGDDWLVGGEGNDYLEGYLGADTLIGGMGNNTYQFSRGDGQDLLQGYEQGSSDTSSTKLSTLLFGSNVLPADLVLKQVNDSWFGADAALEVSIVGTTDKITINGFSVSGDGIHAFNPIQQFQFGIDGSVWNLATIRSRVLTSTGTNVNANLSGTAGYDSLSGGPGDDTLKGLDGNDTLNGSSGDDSLDGGSGEDALIGGFGDDTYVVDNAGDTITEAANGGTDTVESSLTWILSTELENLTLTGTATISGTGNAVANSLVGNTGANRLDGAAGADVMTGGAGDDTYVVDNAADTTVELAVGGSDAVESSINWTLVAETENLTLTGTANINATGNSLINTLIGNIGINRLDGAAGADTMTGGAGNDTYVVDNAADTTMEVADGGRDTVESSINWTLAAETENLTLTETDNINGTGNTAANTLIGNTGNNRLDGAAGADTMTGGAGNDTYVVDNMGDTTIEVASGGTDAIESSISWTLATEVEKLSLTGAAGINGTGNSLANTLIGNAGANVLDGGTGSDSLGGGAGNDTYLVDSTLDVITDNASEGTDTVLSSVTWSLGTNTENLTLTGTSAVNGTGNALANQLMGNSAANTLTGNAGNDRLDGAAGSDAMTGGAGDDTYVVDNLGDTTIEVTSGGADAIESSISWAMATEVEKLTLTGTANLNGTGNAVANTLIGNAGANRLDGGAGADAMTGGA
ncbi:MAG: calcium-binding protein, partial [Rhizobacter sp.]